MAKKFVFDDKLFDNELVEESVELEELEELEEELNKQNSCPRDQYIYLLETDFNLSLDNRVWESNVEDIDGGDNFADYCSYIFKILENEDYFED